MKLLLKGATALSLIAATLLNAGAIEDVENAVVAKNGGQYDITGYFSPYHFSNDSKSNWVFVFSKKYGQSTYQLLGDTSPENLQKMGVFGWKKVSISPLPDPLFYMTRFGNGKFDWLLFTLDGNKCKNVYKLAGQDPNTKAFSYDVDGDGKTDVLKDLTCQADLQNETVDFDLKNQGGNVTPAVTPEAIANAEILRGDITSDKTLTADKLWKIDGLVKVRPGATLTIEPGTIIFGDNIGDDYIVVMKGAKIIADGTIDKPIIFTSEAALKNPANAAAGQWGGVTILGNAPTNHKNPHYEVDENDPDFLFGGDNPNDNSGIIRNVYVLNSGKTIGTDVEINGLSLAGVGKGTIIENVTVKNSSDDCLEVWGGTVDMKNLALENCHDDSLDLDYGYNGYVKGVIVKQVDPAHAGFEISSGGKPMTTATIENFVIKKVDGSDEGGIYIKDDTTAPTFINGVVEVAGDDVAVHTKKPASQDQINTISFKDVKLNPETFDGKAADAIKQRWQANDAKLLSVPAVTPEAIANAEILRGDITSDKTLTADKLWKIDGLVKVRPGATLTIEPGTIIFGDNIGDDYIVVMKGAKIIADGTIDKPIIFTSEAALKNPANAAAGQWGGVTILGNAPTNHKNPHYEVDENDPDFLFGGDNPNDNSGIIRNVYVLNSGKTIGTDVEINGLSLAGVGKGTIIENVTVKNSSDDCLEVWGGTVDMKNLALENCHDDSLDLDYGYNGYVKGVIVKQVDPAHAGFEISSGGKPMTTATIENFVIKKVDGSDEGGIYIKDDTTAPTFINGVVEVAGDDVAVHTKKPASQDQINTISFKDVKLNPETFDGKAADAIKQRWQANDAKLPWPID